MQRPILRQVAMMSRRIAQSTLQAKAQVRCMTSVTPSATSALDKRVALVTGSTSGIGLNVAHGLASRGCDIVLTGFGDPDLIKKIQDDLHSKYQRRVDYVGADLTKPEEITAMCNNIRQLHPAGLDIIVNNAGFIYKYPIEEYPKETWDDTMKIFLTAPFLLIKNFLPDMKKKGWGRIINIGSVHGLRGTENNIAYSTAKHALIGLTKVVAVETADYGITCNVICPGIVDTPIFQNNVELLMKKEGLPLDEAKKKYLASKHLTNQAVSTHQISEIVSFLCSDAASQMTGSSLVVDAGWTAKL